MIKNDVLPRIKKTTEKRVVDLSVLPRIKKTTEKKEKELIRMLIQDNRLALKYLEDK